jgi:hypothetical protein
MAGMRDRLIHDYFGVDYELVWDVVQSQIPKLRESVARLLEAWGEQQAGVPDSVSVYLPWGRIERAHPTPAAAWWYSAVQPPGSDLIRSAIPRSGRNPRAAASSA